MSIVTLSATTSTFYSCCGLGTSSSNTKVTFGSELSEPAWCIGHQWAMDDLTLTHGRPPTFSLDIQLTYSCSIRITSPPMFTPNVQSGRSSKTLATKWILCEPSCFSIISMPSASCASHGSDGTSTTDASCHRGGCIAMVSGERRREAIAKQRKKLLNYMSFLGKVCNYLCISYTHATHSSCWQLHHGEWHL